MAIDDQVLTSSAAPVSVSAAERPGRAWVLRTIREVAVQDWIILGYHTILVSLVLLAGPSPTRLTVLQRVTGLFVACLAAIVLVRGSLVRDRVVAPLVYRFGIFGTLLSSYFLLRDLLPLVNHRALDAQLYALDLRLFGVEPAVWMDQFVTPATTEWFAFFYFFYFFVLAAHVLPMVFAARRRRLLAEFSLGMILVYACSHLLYMVVPGFGPVRALAGHFQHALPDGTWMRAVLGAVDAHGAQKDIFPSLHTGGPVFITLFSIRHRKEMPFRLSWPFVTFFTVNIVIATMFLRWHYVIDVIAGMTLAACGVLVAGKLSPRESDHRESLGLQPVWTTFFDAPRR
jgi:hypothetical protein